MPPPNHASETAIQQSILLDLGARPDLRIWRNNTGVGIAPNGRRVRFGTPGAADILGVLLVAPGLGRMFALEVKSQTGRLREEQRLWGQMLVAHGGYYAVVRSVQQARAALAHARREAIASALSLARLALDRSDLPAETRIALADLLDNPQPPATDA